MHGYVNYIKARQRTGRKAGRYREPIQSSSRSSREKEIEHFKVYRCEINFWFIPFPSYLRLIRRKAENVFQGLLHFSLIFNSQLSPNNNKIAKDREKMKRIIIPILLVISIGINVYLYTQLSEMKQKNADLAITIEETESAVNGLEESLKEIEESKESLTSQIDTLQSENDTLQSENDTLQSEIETLESESESLKEEQEDTQSQDTQPVENQEKTVGQEEPAPNETSMTEEKVQETLDGIFGVGSATPVDPNGNGQGMKW